MGLRGIAPLEFGPREVVAVLERWNDRIELPYFLFFLSYDAHAFSSLDRAKLLSADT